MDLKGLREQKARLISEVRQTIEDCNKENKALSAEALERVDRGREAIKALSATIERAEEIGAMDAAIVPESQRTETREQGEKPNIEQRNEAVSAFLRGRATAEHRSILAAMDNPEFRDQSTTGNVGGYTIAPDTRFYGQIVEALKSFGGMLSAPVTTLDTDTGADLPFPTVDDTSNVGAQVAEAGAHTGGTDVTVGQLTLKAYVVSSKIVKISQQLLQDSSASIDAFVARALGIRVARKLNALLTTGAGTSTIQGIAYAGASVGRTCAAGFVTTVSPDDLLRLKHSVDPAYRDNAAVRWMFNDTSLLTIALLKDGDGQYIWKQGMTDGSPDRLFGKPIQINQDMPDMGASAKPVAFGDFSQYYFRRVKGIQVVRLNELYAENLQVGLMAFGRFDGGLIDAGMHPVRVLVNAAS